MDGRGGADGSEGEEEGAEGGEDGVGHGDGAVHRQVKLDIRAHVAGGGWRRPGWADVNVWLTFDQKSVSAVAFSK